MPPQLEGVGQEMTMKKASISHLTNNGHSGSRLGYYCTIKVSNTMGNNQGKSMESPFIMIFMSHDYSTP